MLSREEIEQLIDQKIEPITEEIAALKGQMGKVDLLVIDNRNIRQSLARLETGQKSLEAGQAGLKLDFERQEKRSVRFEKQVNDQFVELKTDTAILKEQMNLVVTMLRRIVPPEEER